MFLQRILLQSQRHAFQQDDQRQHFQHIYQRYIPQLSPQSRRQSSRVVVKTRSVCFYKKYRELCMWNGTDCTERVPTAYPTAKPTTRFPTRQPTTTFPTHMPTVYPTAKPTESPTVFTCSIVKTRSVCFYKKYRELCMWNSNKIVQSVFLQRTLLQSQRQHFQHICQRYTHS